MAHIAVTPDVLLPSGLKKYALLFDRIVVAGMGWAWDQDVTVAGLPEDDRAEYSWLHDIGFLDDLGACAGEERVAPLWTLRSLERYMPPASTTIPSIEMRVCRKIVAEMRETSTDNIVPFTVCDYRKAARILDESASAKGAAPSVFV